MKRTMAGYGSPEIPAEQPGANIQRRALVAGGAAFVGVSCFSIGVAEAQIRARMTGRPVLTQASFNRLLSERSQRDRGRAVAAELAADIPAFIGNNFTLTPVQERRLGAMPTATLKELQDAFQHVARYGGSVQLTLTEPQRPHELTAVEDPGKGGRLAVNSPGLNKAISWTMR